MGLGSGLGSRGGSVEQKLIRRREDVPKVVSSHELVRRSL